MIVQKVTSQDLARINQFRQGKVGTTYVLPDGNAYIGTSGGLTLFKGLLLNDSVFPTHVSGDVEGDMPFLYFSAAGLAKLGNGAFNIDGGAADSVYTPSLFISGGGAVWP